MSRYVAPPRRPPLPPPRPRRRRRRRATRALGWFGLAATGATIALIAAADRARDGERPAPARRDAAADDAAREAAAAEARERAEGMHVEGPAGRLFVRTAGTGGPALLLVHGLGGSGAHWRPQLAALGDGFRVVAPDLRGHGRSDTPRDGDHSIAAHAADVLAVADALGHARFALAGHSMGALVAIEVAARAPDRVLALALVDPGGDGSDEPAAAVDAAVAQIAEDPRAEFTVNYRSFLHGARPATTRRVLADLAATPDTTLVAGYGAALRYPARARLAAYAGPVLCLASALNDAHGSLPRSVPGLQTEWLAPASHWLMLDRPEQVSGLLAELVASAAR